MHNCHTSNYSELLIMGAYVIESLSVIIDPATNALVNNELAHCLGIVAVFSELAIQWAANPCDDSSS